MIFTALMLAAAPIAQADLVARKAGRDVYPPAFRGLWAAKPEGCSADTGDIERLRIREDRIEGRETESLLLKNGGVRAATGSDGGESYTLSALIAGSAEGDVYLSKLRLVRLGDRLFISNADTVTDDLATSEQFAHVRCPEPKPVKPAPRSTPRR